MNKVSHVPSDESRSYSGSEPVPVLVVMHADHIWNAEVLQLPMPYRYVEGTSLLSAIDVNPAIACVIARANIVGSGLLGEIDWRVAGGQRLHLLLLLDPEEVDLVGASLGYSWIDYACGIISSPDVADIVRRSTSEAARRFAAPDQEVSLLELSEEAARIAHALSKLAAQLPHASPKPRTGEVDVIWIRRTLRLRRMRDRFFPSELFADPAWDMLLDLTAARLEGIRVSTSSLCIAAAVPPTTALRWVKGMVQSGLLVREPDPSDARRMFIDLREDTFQRMQDCLLALQTEGYPV